MIDPMVVKPTPMGARREGRVFVVALLAVLVAAGGVSAQEGVQDELEALFGRVVSHRSGQYYTWRNEEGKIVARMAIEPFPGDTYLDEANHLWEVVQVDEDRTVHVVHRSEERRVGKEGGCRWWDARGERRQQSGVRGDWCWDGRSGSG